MFNESSNSGQICLRDENLRQFIFMTMYWYIFPLIFIIFIIVSRSHWYNSWACKRDYDE